MGWRDRRSSVTVVISRKRTGGPTDSARLVAGPDRLTELSRNVVTSAVQVFAVPGGACVTRAEQSNSVYRRNPLQGG